MAASERFTDGHVRANPDLYRLAIDYAINYRGDYEFLVKAHRYATERDDLPLGVARGVLNCMRNDLNVAADLPDPYGLTEMFGSASDPFVPFGGIEAPRSRRHLTPLPEYKPPVVLKTEFHYGYLVSNQPSYPSQKDPVGHILRHDSSGVVVENGRTVVTLKAWCGWSVSNRRRDEDLRGKLVEQLPPDRRPCRGCNDKLLRAASK